MSVDLTEEQAVLLRRLRSGPVVFSGDESDAERLRMLQLYAIGLVVHGTARASHNAMQWRITKNGLQELLRFFPRRDKEKN